MPDQPAKKDTQTQQSWLEMAEYAAIAGSGIGTIAAVLSSQAAYAAAPLTLAMSLNLANRQRLQQQTQQIQRNTQSAITDTRQFVEQRFFSLPIPSDETVSNISQRLDSLSENFENRPDKKEIAQIKQRLQALGVRVIGSKQGDNSSISSQLNELKQQVNNLKIPAAVDLTEVERTISDISDELKRVSTEITEINHSINTKIDEVILPVIKRISEVEQHQSSLNQNFNNRTEAQHLIQIEQQLKTLQEQLNGSSKGDSSSLSSQLEQLKQQLTQIVIPETVDLSHVHQKITYLSNNIGYLSQSINDKFNSSILPLKDKINTLEHSTDIIYKIIDDLAELSKNFANRTEVEQIIQLQEQLESLKQQFNNLILQTNVGNSEPEESILNINNQLSVFKQQLENSSLTTLNNIEKIEHNLDARITQIVDTINTVDNGIDYLETKINNQFQNLENKFSEFQKSLGNQIFNKDINTSTQNNDNISVIIEKYLSQHINQINYQLSQIKKVKYELVVGRKESRNVLREALNKAEEHLILVCPWIGYANKTLINDIENLLLKGVIISIGWGFSDDIKKVGYKAGIGERLAEYSNYYEAFPELNRLYSKYNNLLELKVIGTHEKYLVCDEEFAMLGSHNFLTSTDINDEKEVGLKTNDLQIIKELKHLFKRAKNLDVNLND